MDGITDWMDMSMSKVWEMGKAREAWQAAVYGVAESNMTDWTTRGNKETVWYIKG